MPPSTAETAAERSGDPLFALVAGLYVALLAIAPTAFAVARLVSGDPAVLYGTVLATVTVGTGLGWWATVRFGSFPYRLGATRARWVPGLVGLGYAFAGLLSLGWAGVFGVLAMFSGMGAMALGSVSGVMARTRYIDALLADSERHCVFTAGWPSAARNRLLALVLPLWAVSAAGFASVFVAPGLWPLTFAQILFPVGVGIFMQSEPREYAVTAEGLEQRLPVARRLLPWTQYTGYTRTADALVVHRSRWFDSRFALADLADPDAVEAALARYLPAT
ncbi:hypothetical protein NDI54_06380 [Haloarcula sp. S1AR25-5A]|uniref:Uncharacterized protein n=1 Tax=Haloarcula terrestris TaxID=2950533 RepID=A0AAE4JIC8_9EURY|nr:hypothetical protein [Haloarcula terrestris]MDS0220971.1 hypothetical protein [Haloarcula terrestris]